MSVWLPDFAHKSISKMKIIKKHLIHQHFYEPILEIMRATLKSISHEIQICKN